MLHKRLALQTLTLIVTCALLQVYVAAGGSAPLAADAPVAPQAARTGRLTTRGNNAITVNGNSAKTGETIFSGQQLQTPAGVGATIQLGALGRVDLAPNTSLTLTFTDGQIGVNLASGCVILTANRGVTGTVEAQGTRQQTDPAKGGTIDVCTNSTPGAPPLVGQGAAAGAGAGAAAGAGTVAAGTAGVGTATTVLGVSGLAGAITAAAITSSGGGNRPNPSPVR